MEVDSAEAYGSTQPTSSPLPMGMWEPEGSHGRVELPNLERR